MVATVLSVFATPNEIVVHTGGAGNGYNQIYVERPHITYDEELNELYVYFGSTSTIDLEYDDGTGTYHSQKRREIGNHKQIKHYRYEII